MTAQEQRLDELKVRVRSAIEAQREQLLALSHRIHDTPEIAFQERQASIWLSDYLESQGFEISRSAYGLPTAFAARKGSGSPVVAYLCEYDALPGVGHGCGHNIIATAGAGAGIGLAAVLPDTGGSVVVLGTPAEEQGGGKVILARGGALEGIDVAMMVHPVGREVDVVDRPTLAISDLEVEYFGKAAHASGTPDMGINALDAMFIAYAGIAALRQHISQTSRIHGIITDGGQAPNIVPEHTAGHFYVRASTGEELEPLKQRVLACFRAGAEATGARLEVRWIGESYTEIWPNPPLASAYLENSRIIGRPAARASELPPALSGSTDMGNISQLTPSLHPHISITTAPIPGHSTEMAAAAATELGDRAAIEGAMALAMTGVDVLARPALLHEIKQAFAEQTRTLPAGNPLNLPR